MKKLSEWMSLLPLALVTFVFLTEKEMGKHAKTQCLSLLLMLILYGILYFLLIHLKVNRYIAIGAAVLLWALIIFVRKKVLV